MFRAVKAAVLTTALVAGTALVAPAANADSTILQIEKVGVRSPSHTIAFVRATVACSEDTESAFLRVTLTQITNGGLQTATGNVTNIGAFECTGDEEIIRIPVRRPLGGFRWVKGPARATNLVFITDDPAPGVNIDTVRGRTITLR